MKYLRLSEILSDVAATETLNFERMRFNGGENHIKLLDSSKEVTIECLLKSSDYVMELFLAVDALRRSGTKKIHLFMPYIPYARQDRVMVPGEPLSIKVFCDMVNAMKLDTVYTLDNHSEVSTALLDNCVELDRNDILWGIVQSQILISPDAGAEKKTFKAAKAFGCNMVTCSKIRQPSTGEIIDVRVNASNLSGRDCFIADDICDGGRTFIEIAKRLKVMDVGSITLYVSHGIFSKGTKVFDGLIDKIYTPNCFRRPSTVKEVTILPITKGMLK